MTVGRDVRDRALVMRVAPVAGGLEPELLTESRQAVLEQIDRRASAYTPEWTARTTDDAGVAIVKVHATLATVARRRLNRVPRRIALDHLHAAGVRPRPPSPARALAAVQVAAGVTAPIQVAAGSVFTTPAGAAGPVLETEHGCSALPGGVAAVAVLAGGWLSLDRSEDLEGLQPFGPRPLPPAELWIGVDTGPVPPVGTLTLALELAPPSGRATVSAAASTPLAVPPLLRWEAMTATGTVELALESDSTRGIDQSGVVAFRVPADLDWRPDLRPGQTTGTALRWLRARLLTSTFRTQVRLQRVVLNGVSALAARSVRGEVAEPVERRPSGEATFRLSRPPVLPGSVLLDVTEPASGLGSADAVERWNEVPSLAVAQPDDRVFLLDPAEGTVTFGDGVHGRAVPEGYRNVVARSYRTGGGSGGPTVDEVLPPEVSIPDLTGLQVLSITTGSPAETASALLVRGPAEIRSRLRAVAAADYEAAAIGTPGVDVARAHALPGREPVAGTTRPGTVGLIVVPRTTDPTRPPVPSLELLQAVAQHLARTTGVAGARVVAAAPRYRVVAVQGLLVAAAGADLAAVTSAARDVIDRWLDPLTGGDHGAGWGFGSTVQWNALVRRLLAGVPDLDAASPLSFRVDGRLLRTCADADLGPGELAWPGTHLLEAVPADGGTS